MSYFTLFLLAGLILLAIASFPAALISALREEDPGKRTRAVKWACASFGLFALTVMIAAFR